MMRDLKLLLTTVLLAVAGNGLSAEYTLKSPNGKILVEVQTDTMIHFSISYEGQMVLEPSAVALGGSSSKVVRAKMADVCHDVVSPFYRQQQVSLKGHQLDLRLKDGFGLQFRAYDEGVAYRFYTTRKGEKIIEDEVADYRFPGNPECWLAYSTNDKTPFAMAFQNVFEKTPLDQVKEKLAFLPATVEVGSVKLTLLESDLRSYPGMFLKGNNGGLTAVFAPYPKTMKYYRWRGMSYVDETENYIAKSTGARTYPWRVFALTENDTEMPVNNLVYALAEPNKIGDTSWIKPGKVAWDWWNDWNLRGVDFEAGINTRTYKYYIDFASKYHLPYIVLDEGWYDSSKGDIMNPINDVDLEELISYGRQRQVGLVLWTVFNVLDEHLQEACSKYAGMGIKGFKIDFLDRNDQTAVEMAERLAKTCAEYQLFVDYHGFYTPTGMNRTYPNILNYEAVFGMEEARWAKRDTDMPGYDVTFPFIRGMAGPVDFTPGAMRNGTKENWVACYQNPVSMGTRCHQAACYVVQDSPFTMLCDAPTQYEQEPDYTAFIASIPDTWEETRILQGELGQYIVTARRKGDTWYVGGQTNWDARTIELPLSFLDNGNYFVTLLTDGINAGHNAEDYKFDSQTSGNGDKLTIRMASGGGFVLKIRKKNNVDHI